MCSYSIDICGLIFEVSEKIWVEDKLGEMSVDLLYFKQEADVEIDIIITPLIVDFGIDQVGETCSSINDNLLAP